MEIAPKKWSALKLAFGLLIASIVVAYAFLLRSGSIEWLEVIANLVLIAGVAIIAQGVKLSTGDRDFLFRIRKQHSEYYANKRELLQMKESVALAFSDIETKTDIKIDCKPDIASIKAELAGLNDVVAGRVSQRNLARLFIEASDKSEAGTLLLVVGSILLVIKALAPLIACMLAK